MINLNLISNKSIMVTGGAGFIGSEFVRNYSASFKKMYIIDSLTYAGDLKRIDNQLLKDNVEFIKSDIRDVTKYEKTLKDLDYIIHFAAESHVDRSINDGYPFVNSNVLGTYALLEAAREFSKIRTLMVSTDEVYGSIPNGEVNEQAVLAPSSAYSASKASADLFAIAQFLTHKQNIVISRCSNNYGAYQNEEKFIPTIITSLLKKRSVPVYGKGKNIREWIHVSDHCAALLELLTNARTGEIYNIGTGDRLSNLEILGLIAGFLNVKGDYYHYVEDRKGHDFRYSLNSEKITSETGWKPKILLENGLRELVLNYNQYKLEKK